MKRNEKNNHFNLTQFTRQHAINRYIDRRRYRQPAQKNSSIIQLYTNTHTHYSLKLFIRIFKTELNERIKKKRLILI